MLKHLLNAYEAHLRLVIVAGLEVLLGIVSSAIEEVKHFGLLVFVVVSVYPKFALHLELPALKGGISSIG